MKKYHLGILAAVLLLNACLPSAATPTQTPTLPPTRPPATQTPFQPATATSTSPPPTATTAPRPIAKRVLVITVDGLRPDVISLAPMPNLQALMETGAYSLTAQTIYPSSTLPAHASMFTGMCPDKHDVYWNDYLPNRGYANGPSVFDIAHDFGFKTVIVAGKEKLQQITRPESIDIFEFVNDRDSVVAAAAAPIIAEGFGLMLIHLPLVDILGHEYGWLSPNYIIGAFRADEAIGMILAALDEAGLRQDTLLIVTADHGGDIKFKHGGRSPAAMTVPWVLSGASLKPMELTRPISVTDTAATIAYALELPIPSIWDGIPVIEAFGGPAPSRVELPCQ
ncbi:MAG: alkaline phosphatase family protein [Anaerolineae bacterium]|nr:alkaline phosphatase family protein [Anaerolineae bacterium]